MALFSSVLAYLFWNRGVEEVGPQVAGLFVHLMPVFGVLLAWVFLGERLAPYHVVGIGLILDRHRHHQPARARGGPGGHRLTTGDVG